VIRPFTINAAQTPASSMPAILLDSSRHMNTGKPLHRVEVTVCKRA
jgi:hypothetical protein